MSIQGDMSGGCVKAVECAKCQVPRLVRQASRVKWMCQEDVSRLPRAPSVKSHVDVSRGRVKAAGVHRQVSRVKWTCQEDVSKVKWRCQEDVSRPQGRQSVKVAECAKNQVLRPEATGQGEEEETTNEEKKKKKLDQ